MTIQQQIKQARTQATKSRDAETKSILTVLLGDIENISLRTGAMDDAQVVALIKKYVTNAEETLKYANDEASSKLKKEISVLEQFLPKQLSADQLISILSASGAENLGQAMAYLKSHYAGQYDGKVASQVAKELLTV